LHTRNGGNASSKAQDNRSQFQPQSAQPLPKVARGTNRHYQFPTWRSSLAQSFPMPSHVLAPSANNLALLLEEGNFVDKSRAIVEFLDDNQPVHLLLRPRRSGKTILLRLFR